MVSRTELAAPRNKWKPTPTHFGYVRRIRRGWKADVAFGLRLLLSQHQPQKGTSKEGLFDRGVVLIPYESILRSMCPSENALEVRASGVRSESFALGKRFAVAKLTASQSPTAKLRPRMWYPPVFGSRRGYLVYRSTAWQQEKKAILCHTLVISFLPRHANPHRVP